MVVILLNIYNIKIMYFLLIVFNMKINNSLKFFVMFYFFNSDCVFNMNGIFLDVLFFLYIEL